MTQTAFLKEIDVNSNSFGRFMKMKGKWQGNGNGTFTGATRFFIEREEKAKAEKSAGGKKRKAEAAAVSTPSSSKKKQSTLTGAVITPAPASAKKAPASATKKDLEDVSTPTHNPNFSNLLALTLRLAYSSLRAFVPSPAWKITVSTTPATPCARSHSSSWFRTA